MTTKIESTPGEGTPIEAENQSPIPAGEPTVGSEAEAKPDTTDTGPRERLTAENFKERAKKAREKAGKEVETPPPAAQNTPPGTPAKGAEKAQKAHEKGVQEAQKPAAAAQAAPAAGESAYKAPGKYTALGKEYDLPKWAQEAMKSKEMEAEIRPLFEKVQAFDHVQTRAKELHGKYTELHQNHNDLVGGIEELHEIYREAAKPGQILMLGAMFENLKIPDNVILHYALARAQLLESDPAQQQIVMGQVQGLRDSLALRKQNAGLETTASSAQSHAMALELNIELAKSDVAPIVQAFDSRPGQKPGSFWGLVKDVGELAYNRDGVVLSPAQAVEHAMTLLGLRGQAAAQALPPNPAPAAAAQAAPQAHAAAAPAVPVVAQGHHANVPVVPRVNAGSGSPTPSKPKNLNDIRRIRKERYGS